MAPTYFPFNHNTNSTAPPVFRFGYNQILGQITNLRLNGNFIQRRGIGFDSANTINPNFTEKILLVLILALLVIIVRYFFFPDASDVAREERIMRPERRPSGGWVLGTSMTEYVWRETIYED